MNKETKEIFLSLDVEADGRIPGRNSMLSFGIAAITIDKEIISTFSRNLKLLPGAIQDPDTMEFWRKNSVAWDVSTCNQKDPAESMQECFKWMMEIKKETGLKLVLVAFPGGYDFMWFHWYMNYFASHNPCGWAVLCLKSYAAALLKRDFQKCTKRNFPSRWFQKGLPHTHVAIDDAVEQAGIGISMIREARGLEPIEKITYRENKNLI